MEGSGMSGDGRVDIWYVLERLEDVRTQTDLDEFMQELRNVVIDYEKSIGNITEDFDIHAALKDVKVDYIERALRKSGNNYTRAAEILGMSNRQTLKNWAKELGK
jgi:transcriptional regulator with PAS, ATPase and Fis domain